MEASLAGGVGALVAVPVLAEWHLFPVPFLFLVSQLDKAYMEFHFSLPASEFDL